MNNFLSNFPYCRARRLRQEDWIRKIVTENFLKISDLILPIFLTYEARSTEIDMMPNVKRNNINDAVLLANKAYEAGIKAVAVFPEVPEEKKDVLGKEALNENNIVCKAVRAIKKNVNGIGVICDIALDPYTISGHDGILENNQIDNDKTIEILCKQAIVNAEAGCDIIAPSDMMDGRIGFIRKKLDENNFQDKIILSYAAKYNSKYYGPFRDAVNSKNNLGISDKSSYQMNPANSLEALNEVAMDIEEGADIVMVKPGMPYLDIISKIKEEFKVPTFAYQVSGEYAMIMESVNKGWLDKGVIIESLTSFKRAGADAVLTYFAKDLIKEFNL